jgi:hypothetical protein
MNALDMLERMGAVPPPDTEVLVRTESMLREMVAAYGPAAGELEIGLPRRAVPHRLGRRRVARVATVAAAVALIATAASVLVPGSSLRPPSAAAELQHLAEVAGHQAALAPPGPGQFQYTESQAAYTATTVVSPQLSYTVLVPQMRQIWVGPDGSGRLVESFGAAQFLDAQDRTAWVQAGSPSLVTQPVDESFGPGGLSAGPVDLSTLPTDPASLGALIAGRKVEGGPPGTAEDFVQIGDLLRESDAAPTLRATLYQVAAGLPGVQLLGTVTDHAGRRGVGLADVSNGTRHELIFDPATAALLGEEDVIVGPGPAGTVGPTYPVGTVASWAVYLASAVVGSTSAGPPTTPGPAAAVTPKGTAATQTEG